MKSFAPVLLFIQTILCSQPLVHEEPHHVPVIENRNLRVLNVTAQPGDTTQFHIHKTRIAYFTIKGSIIWLEELNKEPRAVELPTGWIGSDLTYPENPFIHRFANLGDSEFQLLAIESLTDRFVDKEFSRIGNSLFTDERFDFQEPTTNNFNSEVPFVLIELNQTGEVIALDWVKPKQRIQLISSGPDSRFIIIQVK